MPYIAIQAYPKDEEIKKRVVERINQVFLEEWGCPQSAISISMEEVAPESSKTKESPMPTPPIYRVFMKPVVDPLPTVNVDVDGLKVKFADLFTSPQDVEVPVPIVELNNN